MSETKLEPTVDEAVVEKSNDKPTKKRGRPYATKIPRERRSVVVAIQEGAFEKLLEKFKTSNVSKAVREAIHQSLKIVEEKSENTDSNVTRRRRKQKAKNEA